MKTIKLTQGQVTIVDDEDFEELNKHKWYAHKNGTHWYVRRYAKINGRYKKVFMHREILHAPTGIGVDHKDNDGLNNLKTNIRLANKVENSRNRGPNKNNKSGFKGVSWRKDNQKWEAMIEYSQKHIHLGKFSTKEEAALAYNKAAIQYFGEFAYLNAL
jgi:hypothetical protein